MTEQKKITNLRPKDGIHFELDDLGYVKTVGDRQKGMGITEENYSQGLLYESMVSFDVLQAEYQVGDIVEIKTMTDTGYIKPGASFKGMVTRETDFFHVTVAFPEAIRKNVDADLLFDKVTLLSRKTGYYKIVGVFGAVVTTETGEE